MLRKLIIFVFLTSPLGALSPSLYSKGAILMNGETGAILYEKKGNTPFFPASLTKVATALYLLEHLPEKRWQEQAVSFEECLTTVGHSVKEEHEFKLPSHWLEPDGSHFFLLRGERLSLEDLFSGMMMLSGNDAANVLAHHVGGSVSSFMEKMKEYLRSIGVVNSSFQNPHGLHDPMHLATPKELALITKRALKFPKFVKMIGQKQYERPKTFYQEAKACTTHNRLLKNGTFFYEKALGGKTGYTLLSGYNLIAVASDGSRKLIAVLLGAKEADQRYEDAINLFEEAFQEKKKERLLFKKGNETFLKKVKGAKSQALGVITEDVFLSYYPSEEPLIRTELIWNVPLLPIEKGALIGSIKVSDEKSGQVIQEVPLYAKEALYAKGGLSRFYMGLFFIGLFVVFIMRRGKRRAGH